MTERKIENVLDYGFVELVDHMGSDLTVVNAARVSFGKRKEVMDASDEKLIKYLANHAHFSPFRNVQLQFHCKVPEFVARQWYKHCYTDDTSILTDSGWKLFSDLLPTDLVAQVSEDDESFEFVKPTDYVSYKYAGDIHEYKSQTVSLAVTPEHRMVVQKRKKTKTSDGWAKSYAITSNEVMKGGEYKLPKLPTFNFKVDGGSDDYEEGLLYGFYIGDGSSSSSANRITFGLKKDRKVKFLEELLESFGGFNKRIAYRNGYTIFHIDNPDNTLFKGLCTNDTKSIDLEWTLGNKQRAVGVLEGLLQSDGCRKPNETTKFFSAQKKLVDDIRTLCTYLGYDTTLWTSKKKARSHILSIKRQVNRHLISKYRSVKQYDAMVYCVTVPSGKLLVQRDNIISVCGNCIGAEYSIGAKDHGWNEISQRYVDASEFEFYTPEGFRKQSPSNKQASTDELVVNSEQLEELYDVRNNAAFDLYALLVEKGVAKEQARGVLPLSIYTEFYWTISLQALANFIKLRRHEGSQYEIRLYAEALEKLALQVVPVSLQSLLENT